MAENRDYYFASEITGLLSDATPSYTTFYRCAKAGKIKKFVIADQDVYSRSDVDAFLRGDFSSKGRKDGRGKRHLKPGSSEPFVASVTKVVSVGSTESSVIEPSAVGETDWIQESDLPYVFALDYELYGLEVTVSPLVTRFWWQKNPYACRILFNRDNRKDVWGALTILPLEEETIFRLLRNELQEKDIVPEQILVYESGKIYDGYVASLAIRPERNHHLRPLLQSVLDHWCNQYPQIQLRRLYAFVLGGEGGEGMSLVRKLFFSPLYERRGIEFENAWELRLDRYNPSKLLQQFQDCIKQKKNTIEEKEVKQSMAIVSPVKERFDEKGKMLSRHAGLRFSQMASRAVSTGRFREVRSDADFQAMVEIGDLIFGASNVPDEVLVNLFTSWWNKNQAVFHVLDVDGHIEGFASLLPLTQKKIGEIIQEQVRMSGIRPEDILPFEPGKPVDLFVHVLGVRPSPNIDDSAKRAFGGQLIEGIVNMFADFGRRGVEIAAVHARSNTPDGIDLSGHLGFEDVPPPPDITKKVFLLDVQTSPILAEYRRLLSEYKRASIVSNT